MSEIIQFEDFWKGLDVEERIEKIVREVLIGQSELKTLTESYKRVIQSHKIDIKKIITGDTNQESNRETQLEALENLNKQIQESEDIVKINELFGKFKELSENLKNNDEEEKILHQKLFEIRKQNDRFLRLTQSRLDEYCQRMMIMSEEHRSKKRNFDDNLDKEKDLMKDELIQAITLEFQKLRVKKLQHFVEDLEEIHFKHYNTQLDEYKDIIEKHKVLNLHVFQLENQLRATKFEKRKLPYNHAREIDDLTKSINHQNQTIRELEELLSEEQVSRVKSVQVAKREKRKLNLKLSKMLSESARNQALLCKQVHQALRKNLQVPARILEKSCKDVDECRCGEKEKSYVACE
ncbi:unnamed protein product [Caenorhabditis angaria]|uniref:Uncharacterized protein n=1 Tax=Caenorhabditis angaria TaxID=860376 RepID=A0A9P1J092_9PELO|nr:unnamed protein product [Caenorhabditis angaria]